MPVSSALGSSALLPAGLGFRNVLINGNFSINQRGYTSASNLASGSYGFDRWKSTFTNTTLTFTSAPQGQIVTINTGGSIRQVIERANIVPGTYILSWTGTAGGRVYNEGASTVPSYNTGNSLTFVLDGTANVNVEFAAPGSTATLGNAQLERNFQPTPFEQRPIGVELALCQRYYYQNQESGFNRLGVVPTTTTSRECPFFLPVTMRAAPTVTISGGIVYIFATGVAQSPTTTTVAGITTQGGFQISSGFSSATAGETCAFDNFLIRANAEL
jgi:hypothetical protein